MFYSLLVRALLFTKSGFFVNPARAPLDVFVEDGGRLKLKGPLSTAVCLMTGIITECCIISEGMSGPPDSVKSVHKVCIAPFRQDFRRDTTAWGKVLGFNTISCAVSDEGIAFTTRPKSTFFAASSGEFYLFPYFCILYNVS
jgi:hypothetical protein